MATPIKPAHYLVFHPERKRTAVKVRAGALIQGQLEPSWSGTVWVDSPPGNEDPFVLGPSWAYSYCHATQLRRSSKRARTCVDAGSCLLFCSGDFADQEQVLCVDTVFWVAAAHSWSERGEPHERYSKDVSCRSDLWSFHLRFGNDPGGHKGRYTYEAALFPHTDGRYSRLPLHADGVRVRVPIHELPHELAARIKRKLYGKRPVPVSDAELPNLIRLVEKQTTIEVVSNIEPNDPKFMTLRQKFVAGCQVRKWPGTSC